MPRSCSTPLSPASTVQRRRPSKEQLPPLHHTPATPAMSPGMADYLTSPSMGLRTPYSNDTRSISPLSPQSRELPVKMGRSASTPKVQEEGEKIVRRKSKRKDSMSSEDTTASSRLSSQASECSTPTPSTRRISRSNSHGAIRHHKSRSPTSDTPTAPTPISGGGSKGINWVRGKPLGAGHFGTVYKAFHPETLQIFAVKEAVLEDGDRSAKQRDRLDIELRLCKNLGSHKNVVQYLGHDYTEGHLYIYLEYVPGGSLSSLLAEFGPLTGAPLRKASLGMLEGLDYLHTYNPPVVHRDLKGANILVDLDMCVKLADFGCSKCSSNTNTFTTLGSIPWMAPEVITQEGYGRKADIWSFGCTLIEMATAEKPWGNGAFENIVFALNHIATSDKTPQLPDPALGVPEACCDMIKDCVQRNKDKRPGTTKLFAYEWLQPLAADIKVPLRRIKTFP